MNAPQTDRRPPSQKVLDLLFRARELLDGEGTRADQFGRVAVHLIDCVIDVSKLLDEDPDLDAARVALGSARSAVVAATCAVRGAYGREKVRVPPDLPAGPPSTR
ncbi:hypothetical protein [Streptomyces daghestanicus]|uniref:Uncharacterized protein n=1 Tax=Streptomyces daghestanicus TaxID=66885 RepID=A0ABQ3Q7Y0_9ACTN|nr:hypothetical protein [Streptomyces daghestanicus]GGU68622.1 hypothetical protein GCM10010259_68240 [Streptomyces daghestanicus]GHI33370.1 hypothetical protein Sdagh_51000 [Streptomyces daghestanicus]